MSAASIDFDDFLRVQIHTGTIIEARLNPKARVPAYVLTVDFGEMGTRTSSAQLTANYQPEDLLGRQIVAVTNFPVKRIAGVRSEVLVLGALDDERGVVLLQPGLQVANGMRIA
jgi:tRNA-binding protein